MATIAENLSRIQSAKADIKTAIEAKGVTVPSSATIDTYATYVANIPSGGGSNALIKSIDIEDFTGTTFNRSTSYITSITIPSGVTSIGSNAFQNCSGLTSVTIPSGVTSIGSSAFQNCSSLTSIDIPSGVTSIDSNAFQYCSGLTSVTIPSGVTSIGSSAFQDCRGLTSATILSGVTTIGNYAFYQCRSLTSIDLPDSVTSIGNDAFNGCSGLTSVTIPSGVTSIGRQVFSGCKGLTSIDLPDSVTSIGNSAFQYCSGLTSVTIPSGVTSIAYGAFYGCSGLTSIDLPSGVTSIGGSVFYACGGLTSVIVNAITPPTLGTSVFNNTNNCPIYVPSASVETYKAATNWSTYASRIEAIPSTPTLQWEQYYLGDTVPSSSFYGVKLGVIDINNASIEFGDAINDYIGFAFDVNSEYGWYAQDMSREQIDISEYYDETERCFIIYFSDLGLGAMPISYPVPNESFEFDIQLYQEASLTSN